jgi:hypothetical protein
MPRLEHDNWTISSVQSGHLSSVFCGQPTSALTLTGGWHYGRQIVRVAGPLRGQWPSRLEERGLRKFGQCDKW